MHTSTHTFLKITTIYNKLQNIQHFKKTFYQKVKSLLIMLILNGYRELQVLQLLNTKYKIRTQNDCLKFTDSTGFVQIAICKNIIWIKFSFCCFIQTHTKLWYLCWVPEIQKKYSITLGYDCIVTTADVDITWQI